MAGTGLTVLVEDLAALAAAAGDARYTVLERCLARATPVTLTAATADHLRLSIFSVGHAGPAPVAALTALADGVAEPGDPRYWLRADPVTLSADMTRVFLTAHGLEDVAAEDRAEIRDCVAAVLLEAGHALHSGHPARWCLPLDAAPGFDFPRLDEALGRDLADVLPGVEAAREWRRLLTEVQVALHHAPVTRRRRDAGLRNVNGAWIWGGGVLPEAVGAGAFARVVSDHPVSRGLGVLSGAAIETSDRFEPAQRATGDGPTLLDWAVGRSGAAAELARLEGLVDGLLQAVGRTGLEFTLFDGSGSGWRVDRAALRRFWRRPGPLRDRLARSGETTR